jgi:hypothetical protein
MTEEQKEKLYQLARDAYALGESQLKSWSGADQADSEVYFCARHFYVDVAAGVEVEEALAKQDRRWREYAKEQAAKVAAAPKIKRGPSSGHSVISHRWVDADKFQSHAIHLRQMVRLTLGVKP